MVKVHTKLQYTISLKEDNRLETLTYKHNSIGPRIIKR